MKALNVKFIMNLKSCKSQHASLPLYWITKYFENVTNIRNEDVIYFRDFCKNKLNIITQCFFKPPRRKNWNGHPFYLQSLETLISLTREMPKSIHELLSTPLWYNRFLKTSFDCELSRNGINYVRDIVSEGVIVNLAKLDVNKFPKRKQNMLTRIKDRFPEVLKDLISSFPGINTIVCPELLISRGGSEIRVKNLKSCQIYDILIGDKIRLPTGILRWKNKYFLSEERIKFAFTFARTCVQSTKLRHFQFKISTFTLPTEEYL